MKERYPVPAMGDGNGGLAVTGGPIDPAPAASVMSSRIRPVSKYLLASPLKAPPTTLKLGAEKIIFESFSP